MRRACLSFLLLIGLLLPAAAFAKGADATVQTVWRLLDYIAVDYPGAVADGRVVNPAEFREMTEFSATVTAQLATLPDNPAKSGLREDAGALQRTIAGHESPDQVELRARKLADRLLAAYPIPQAPASPPDLARGATLYAQNCAACHGAAGRGDGPSGAGLDPPPIDFTDAGRAGQRSAFALYQVIDQGLEDTAMQSFAAMPDEDKWALAFYVGHFAYPAALTEHGQVIWEGDAALRARISTLDALTGLTPAALAEDIGEDRAAAVMAYLRSHPDVVADRSGSESLELARELLAQSLATYEAGDRDGALDLALAAYLEGFEPVETLLAARDAGLVAEVERAMGDLRGAIGDGRPANEIRAGISRLNGLFDRAEAALSPDEANATATFAGAFAILLREGLEALLIVVAMITFLIRTDRRELLRWVHAGWIGALVAGVGTWWAATNLISISGAGRELTEGFGSLLAAAILLFVGIWMHGKSQAGAWQAYVRDKLDKALSQGSAWLLFVLAFIAVYREVFETIIFYAALGAQGEGLAMAGGMGVAALLLALIAWAMLRFSRNLPIGKFFAYSAALIAVLAVVLAGKGMAALQEAGLVGFTALPGVPRSPILGLFPTAETLAAQGITILLLVAGFVYAQRTVPRADATVPVSEG